MRATSINNARPAEVTPGAPRQPLFIAAEQSVPMTDGDFQFIRSFAMRHAGIALAEYKKNMVYRRVTKRLRALGLRTVREYCAYLENSSNADEFTQLVNALTTNKTDFFRENHHFDHLIAEALPSIIKRAQKAGGRRMRLWSAGCSSGQEPYSIAMTLDNEMAAINQWDARVLATDIDTDILAKARSGIYSTDEIRSIPEQYRRAYLEQMGQDGTRHRVVDSIRSRIAFRPLNLHERWPMRGPFDVIFCRNVVIYFDKTTQCVLFDKVADILVENGLLYLGHSESLYKVSDRFRPLGQSIYQKIR